MPEQNSRKSNNLPSSYFHPNNNLNNQRMTKTIDLSRSFDRIEYQPNRRSLTAEDQGPGPRSHEPSCPSPTGSTMMKMIMRNNDNYDGGLLAAKQLEIRTKNKSQLKQITKLSAMMCTLAMVGIVELNITSMLCDTKESKKRVTQQQIWPDGPNLLNCTVIPYLHIVYACNTILLMTVNFVALMICNCMMPGMEARDTAQNFRDNLQWSRSPKPEPKPESKPNNKPPTTTIDQSNQCWITVAWILSHIIGVFLFVAELIICMSFKLIDVKFNFPMMAIVIGVTIPTVVILIFVVVKFQRS